MLKNKFKNVILVTFLLLIIMLGLSIDVNAYEKIKITHNNINEPFTMKVGELILSDVIFAYSTEDGIVGLTGTIQNYYGEDCYYDNVVKFFSSENDLITTIKSIQVLPPNEINSYSNINDFNPLNDEYTLDDIAYFTIDAEIYTKNEFEEKFNNESINNLDSSNDNEYMNDSEWETEDVNFAKYDNNTDIENDDISTQDSDEKNTYKKRIGGNNEYTITNYGIEMIVNENNTFDITENITANFMVKKHGIFRKLPLTNKIQRLDGTTSKNSAQVNNIKISETFSTYVENGYKVLKIGDANKTFTGRRSYAIKYNYNIGKDPLKNADELYFNIIGNEWDTTIDNISFKIVMPKEFDKSTLGFSVGEKNSVQNRYIDYNVSGNVITGKVNRTLDAGEGLTVRLTLPEGYFAKAKTNIDTFSIIIIGISFAFVFIGYILWKKHGKDDQVIETVEFYPLEGYNSAEIAYLYEGTVSDEAVISLLIELANKGYLKIEDNGEEESFFSFGSSVTITKLKEYDGNNENERLFFNGLFKNAISSGVNVTKAKQIVNEAKLHGETISFKEALEMSRTDGIDVTDSVTPADLYNKFYKTVNAIKSNIDNKKNKSKIFETAGTGKQKWVTFMAIAIFVLITLRPIMNTPIGIFLLPFALLFPGIGFTVLITMVFGKQKGAIRVNGVPTKSTIAYKLFGLVWGGVFGGVPWCAIVFPALLAEKIYIITYAIGIVCILILMIIRKYMPKRTAYGNEVLGKIQGFKRFLETAEKEQLERLVMQNPEYFYNILPYTYALGVSDIWISQFETIAIQEPNWYYSPNGFNMHNFGNFMTKTMNSAANAMSSSPSSGSSGGSSGGGSSGGGSGGGGGGSW